MNHARKEIRQKMKDCITIKGARENNLKNIDLTVPRDKLIVFTGLSGSGKSSLAFETIFAEGQRRTHSSHQLYISVVRQREVSLFCVPYATVQKRFLNVL